MMTAAWTTSSIPRVKAALVDLLRNQDWPVGGVADQDPQISYGAPSEPAREVIVVGDTTVSDQQWRTLGTRARDEDFALLLVVDVLRPGDEQQAATERAFELFGVIELALRAAPSVGVGGLMWAEMLGPDLVEIASDEGYGAIIRAAVRVRGRI